MKKCPFCNSRNKDWDFVCKSCGAELPLIEKVICPDCGMEHDSDDSCCPYCGYKEKKKLFSARLIRILTVMLIISAAWVLLFAALISYFG